MKIVISESQYNRLIETEKKPKILEFPSLEFFDNDPFEAWTIIQKILQRKGNPPYSIDGDLNFLGTPIESLGNLKFVGGYLDLQGTPLFKKYTEKQIRKMVNVVGDIYL